MKIEAKTPRSQGALCFPGVDRRMQKMPVAHHGLQPERHRKRSQNNANSQVIFLTAIF